ncbi:hypothetical protein AB8P51_14965 [Muriicola sp. SD30]|uniref:hypothetical protein n=1 Tax=Muriicola sp. SD30 TaxID=3240936 RepID=UPI00350F0BBF
MTEREIQDSINSIITLISDDWRFINKSNTNTDLILLPELEKVNIQHWEKINTYGPVNEITISGMKFEYIDSISSMQGWTYDDKAIIEYRDSQFGLYITHDSISGFVGINKLNDSLLHLNNGQWYQKIN